MGTQLGKLEGLFVGLELLGAELGCSEGFGTVGTRDGIVVGTRVGTAVGTRDGALVGTVLGAALGFTVGMVTFTVGFTETGLMVGLVGTLEVLGTALNK